MNTEYLKWTDQNVKSRQDFFASMDIDGIADDLAEIDRRSNKENIAKSNPKYGELILDDREFPGRLRQVLQGSRLSQARGNLFHRWTVNSVVSTTVQSKRKMRRSLAVHPSETSILTAVTAKSKVYLNIETETCHMAKKSFELEDSFELGFEGTTNLWAATSDGCVHKLDLERSDCGFSNICNSAQNKNLPVKSFCIAEPNEFWLGQKSCELVRYDPRDNSCDNYDLGSSWRLSYINSVSVNIPLNLVCTNMRDLAFWDRRMLSPSGKNSKAKILEVKTKLHNKRNLVAHFHPRNPFLLTSGSEGIEIFEWKNSKIESIEKYINQHMEEGGAIASWHPTFVNPMVFGCGHGYYHGGILLYSLKTRDDSKYLAKKLRRQFTPNYIEHELLNWSKLGLIAFHPSLPIVASCNNKTSSDCIVHVIHFTADPE